jgi:hypothetical protein
MKNVLDKICTENQNTHFTFNNLSSGSHGVYEIMWKKVVELGRPQKTTECGAEKVQFACRVTKTTIQRSSRSI